MLALQLDDDELTCSIYWKTTTHVDISWIVTTSGTASTHHQYLIGLFITRDT